jgi:hypothetical protein
MAICRGFDDCGIADCGDPEADALGTVTAAVEQPVEPIDNIWGLSESGVRGEFRMRLDMVRVLLESVSQLKARYGNHVTASDGISADNTERAARRRDRWQLSRQANARC